MGAPTGRREAFRLKPFLSELTIYAILMFAYFFLVLHFLTGWFKDLFEHQRTGYALAGLGVMTVQAVGLEYLTRVLLAWSRAKKS